MPRVKSGRHSKNPCATCLIVCSVILVLLIVGVMVGSVVAFNHFVSPLIGGVKLGECIKILNTVRRADRDKTIDKNEEFSQEDLNDFYVSLNSMLYQKELSEEEYLQRYEALSEEEKENLTYEEYKQAHPFRIDLDVLSNALDLESLLSGNKDNAQDEGEVATAGEVDKPEAEENPEEGESKNEIYINLIKEMYFDFSALNKYPYFEDEEDFSYTTFEITGKQLASVINEIMDIVLKSLNLGEKVSQFENVNLKDYFGIPVIALKNVEGKDKLTLTVELKLRKLINEVIVDMLVNDMNVPKFAVNVVKGLFPKDFFLTVDAYPTDNDSEIFLRINHADEKTSNNIKKIVNALTENFNVNLFPKDEESEDGEQTNETESIFKQVNRKVVDIFSIINDYVPLKFVSDEQGSATLRVAHIQSLLKISGLFDEEDLENSVTPHMFFTTLRCLFDEAQAVSNKEELDSLYVQLDEKYGIDRSYWQDRSLLDPETLKNLTSQIDVSDVEFKDNEQMKVFVHDGQLTTLVDEALKGGYFTSSDSEVATAGETENGNDILSKINFEAVKIKKRESQNLSSYTKGETNYTNVKADIYIIDATLSLTLDDLLNANKSDGEESETNPIIETLTKSLPQKLCLALVLNVKDVYDQENNLIDRIVGAEVMPTTFKINNFDENYSKKVFDIITLMVGKFNSDFNFDLESVTSQIEKSFENVFSTVSDNLYCNIELSERDENNANSGCLVLPSVYEVVYGLSNKEIENSATLTKEDSLSKEEIRELFVQIYNTEFLVLEHNQATPSDTSAYEKVLRKFNPSEGEDFLRRLSGNYYLKTPLTSDSLFGEEKIEFGASSFVFKGENGLYHDQRSLEELDTALNGSALASVINGGINLADLISNNDGSENLIKSLSIINCVYEWDQEVLFLNFEFSASMKEESTSGAGEDSNAISLESFLPEKAYLTATVVLYTDEESRLYDTELLLNNGGLDKISRLAKIFSGGNFQADTLNSQVKESLSKTFDSVKKLFNLKYVVNSEDAVVFKNVFNTINKLSHPDSETDSAKHEDYLAYESLTEEEKNADDQALRARLKEFGREPEYQTKTEYDNETEVKIVENVAELNYFSNDARDIFSVSDIDEFFQELNANFYISDDNLLTADNIGDLTSISSSFVDFSKLYYDERDISELDLKITGNRFTAIANKFTGYSISLDSTSGDSASSFGQAKLIQSKFSNLDNVSYIEIVILVEIHSQDEILDALLPSHIFLTAKLNLSEVDENGKNTYPLDLYINNFTQSETDDVMRRLNLLENALGFETGFSLDAVKANLSENISSVLDNYSQIFDGFRIKGDYIDLPNIFEYITNGTIEHDGKYNTEKPMFETFHSGSAKCVYGIENGKVGYYENNNFILVKATVDGNEEIATAIRNQDNIWGYLDNGNFVSIQTLPEELMNDLRNFGRKPAEKVVTLPEGSILGYTTIDYQGNTKFISSNSEKEIQVFQPFGLGLIEDDNYFFNEITDSNGTYYHDATEEIITTINNNFYINEAKRISVSSFGNSAEKLVLNNDMFSFDKLYSDQRAFEDLLIKIKGNAFASLIHDIYPNGFSSEHNDDFNADIVQMRIYSKELSENADNLLYGYSTLKTVLRLTLSNSAFDGVNILPEYLYLTVFTILDTEAKENRFACEVVINNFGYGDNCTLSNQFESTEAFVDRLNVLKNNFNVQFNFDLDDIKETVKTTFKSLFEDSLQSFGDLKFENDALLIPNIFQLLTDGQITDDGSGKLSYVSGEEILASGTVLDHRMYELDGSLTSPELLRDRLKELGNTSYEGAIQVRGTENRFYNDNPFVKAIDEDAFYSDMQAFYFLKNKPSFNDLKDSTLLDGLTDNIENVFNLRGKDGVVYGDDIKQNYLDFGLYNYAGVQSNLKMSDRALASLIGSQNTIDLTSNMMLKELVITSLKLDYKNEKSMTIEITIKATTRDKLQAELNAMPEFFYLTAITERTVDDSGVVSYSSKIALNGFSPDELNSFLANIAHIEKYSSLGITENFHPEDIANAVETALKETFESNLSDYIEGFGKYENNEDYGVGYIQFKSIYSELLKYTGASVGNEKDIQNVIVKLNNSNDYLEKNKYDASNALTMTDLFARSYFTDREFAYMLNGLLKADTSTNYITVEQLVILKGLNSEYEGYENLIKNLKPDFALTNEDNGYFLITVSINTAQIASSVSLAPETIHISLLFDSQGNFVKYNDGEGEKSLKFIQDFSSSEQALFMSIFTDEENTIDVDAKIEEYVKYVLNIARDTSLHQSDNFNEYCGYVGNK